MLSPTCSHIHVPCMFHSIFHVSTPSSMFPPHHPCLHSIIHVPASMLHVPDSMFPPPSLMFPPPCSSLHVHVLCSMFPICPHPIIHVPTPSSMSPLHYPCSSLHASCSRFHVSASEFDVPTSMFQPACARSMFHVPSVPIPISRFPSTSKRNVPTSSSHVSASVCVPSYRNQFRLSSNPDMASSLPGFPGNYMNWIYII